MTEIYYDKIIGVYGISGGYMVTTPHIARNKGRYVLAILALIGIILAAIGLIAGVITPEPWAAGVFVAGVASFCIAG